MNGFAHSGSAVGGEVVHHHDVAGLKRRHQRLFDVGQEGGPHACPIKHKTSTALVW